MFGSMSTFILVLKVDCKRLFSVIKLSDRLLQTTRRGIQQNTWHLEFRPLFRAFQIILHGGLCGYQGQSWKPSIISVRLDFLKCVYIFLSSSTQISTENVSRFFPSATQTCTVNLDKFAF